MYNNKKQNLLALCQLFYPELVSTGQTLTELGEVLAELGMNIEVVCGPLTIVNKEKIIPKDIAYHGIKIHRVWGTRFPKLNLFGRIINQVTYASSTFFYLLFDFDKRRPILVLTNPPFLAFYCAILRSLGIGKPYCYLVFDVYPDTAINLGVLKEKSILTKLWDRMNIFTYKHAEKIVVIGRCMREIIIDKMRKYRVDYSDKIHYIHIWSDDRLIQSVRGQPNPLLTQWQLTDKFVISYSGNMGRFHDMETIMEAAHGLQSHPDILFLFIGEGYKKQWMLDFAKTRKLVNCQFHSYVPREQLGFSLSCAQLGLVSLAKGQEGLSVPSKTFGLLAAGVPVIAVMSKKSEIARVILEEECGLVVEPGDEDDLRKAVLSLYNNRMKLAEFSRNAISAINTKYNLHSAAESYFELIKNINIH